ncbi:MAG: hypothetical protein RLZZ417_2222 [Bacteroidota bacterium]|jgi:tetratricopeptide (TPR) repeat protein
MNPNVAIAYAPENQKAANKILQDFKNTSIQFNLVSSKEYTDSSIYNQLEHFQGPIILLVSVNFLQSLACMQHTLSLVTKKTDQLVPILVNGLIPDPENGELREVPTAIDKIGDIIPYINYWQSQYLEARSQKSEIRSEEAEKIRFENYSNILRMVSSEAGETLRHLRKFLPPTLIECRSFKNRYQLVQDQLIDFPFQENLFLEDEIEIESEEIELYTPPPFPDSKFIEFEDEIVESKPSLVSDVNDIADKEEMFNFTTTMPLVEPETLAGDQGINTELDNLIDDHVADFSTSITTDIPQLPIGTVDLTQPKIEFSENKTDTLLFGEDETELQEELPPLPQVIEKEIILHDEIMVSEEVSANFVSDEIPINIESDSEIDSVVSLYNQVLKQYPLDITKQYFHLKLVLREVDNDHQRLNYLLPFVENNPDHLEAKVAVSKIYQSLGKWEDAKSLLEEILLIHPNHGESIYELASLLISHFPDRMERAGNLLKQCLRQLNYPKEALYTYAIYLNSISNKPYKALEYYLKTIEALPNHKFAYYDIATFYFNEGEKKIAREFYLKSVQNNPELKIPDNDLAFDVHPS